MSYCLGAVTEGYTWTCWLGRCYYWDTGFQCGAGERLASGDQGTWVLISARCFHDFGETPLLDYEAVMVAL